MKRLRVWCCNLCWACGAAEYETHPDVWKLMCACQRQHKEALSCCINGATDLAILADLPFASNEEKAKAFRIILDLILTIGSRYIPVVRAA